MNVIEIAGLRKEYRRLRGRTTIALNGLDLTADAGGVFGFLGPNGSGKTTTIRCLQIKLSSKKRAEARPKPGSERCRVTSLSPHDSTRRSRHDFDTRATQNDEKRRKALQLRIMALTWDDARFREGSTSDENTQGTDF